MLVQFFDLTRMNGMQICSSAASAGAWQMCTDRNQVGANVHAIFEVVRSAEMWHAHV